MIGATATNALLHIIHAQSNDPDKLDEPKLDSKTHKNGEQVKTNNVRPSTPRETHISAEAKHQQSHQYNPTINGLAGPEGHKITIRKDTEY